MIKMCLEDGMSVTRVELAPCSVPSHNLRSHPDAGAVAGSTSRVWSNPDEPKKFDLGGWHWFNENLFNSIGVIECRTAVGTGHAMAYEGRGDHSLICDPGKGGDVFEFRLPQDTEQRDRFLVALWRIENILP